MSVIDLLSERDSLLHLVRHGATPPNLLNPPIMQGKGIDEPLAEIGRRQAECVAAALATRPLAAVYCSPLKRAVETAATIAAEHGVTVTPVESLVEVRVGRWSGKTWPQIAEEEPDAYRLFREAPDRHGYPGGETLRELHDRVAPTLEELMRRHAGEEFAVVAHSVVNRVYVGSLLGLSLAEGYDLPQANCCVNLIRYRQGGAKLVTFNAVAHLM